MTRENLFLIMKRQFPAVDWREAEPMDCHTTFRIGGPAEVFAAPKLADAVEILAYCRKENIPVTVLGNGSNVLVADAGIPGVVLSFGKEAADISLEETDGRKQITAGAGALLSAVARFALEHHLAGLAFAAGIPGTTGGGLLMNAGAYGGCIADVVTSAKVLLTDGTVATWSAEEMDLSYRHSRMMEEQAIILEVTMTLNEGNRDEIEAQMQQMRQQRQEKQPLEFPSAGSTFKRPEGYFAGKLIMDAGLRGYRVGDAQVSQKHCGFVVNRGHATAAQVQQLMRDVAEEVEKQFGVPLEPEVRLIGDFENEAFDFNGNVRGGQNNCL